MAAQPPPQLKALAPYLQRAHQLASRNALVSYYCKTYAAQIGITLLPSCNNDAACTEFLTGLMDDMDKEKASLPAATPEEAKNEVNNFALVLFKKADDQERTGNVSAVTTQLFYTSSILMTVSKQFGENGELDEGFAEKVKYAKWKAASIKQALDAGEAYVRVEEEIMSDDDEVMEGGAPAPETTPQPAPVPNPYAPPPQDPVAPPPMGQPSAGYNPYPPPTQAGQPSEADLATVRSTGYPDTATDPYPPPAPQPSYTPAPAPTPAPQPPVAPAPVAPAPAPAPVQPVQAQAPAAAPLAHSYQPASTHQPAPVAAPPMALNGFEPSFEAIQEATKYSRYSVSALQFSDVRTAVTNLRKALDLCEGRTLHS